MYSLGLKLVEVSCKMRGKRWYGVRWPRWRGVVSRVKASDASFFSSDWGFESFGICRDIMP